MAFFGTPPSNPRDHDLLQNPTERVRFHRNRQGPSVLSAIGRQLVGHSAPRAGCTLAPVGDESEGSQPPHESSAASHLLRLTPCSVASWPPSELSPPGSSPSSTTRT